MGKILCVTRGGEASIQTQQAAIRRANQTGDVLVFFYVVDLEFLAFADYALRSDIVEEQMDNMAKFLMVMAVERAAEQGVEASYLIRHGDFAQEVVRTAKEEKATLVVLGKPGQEKNQFKLDQLKEMAESLQQQSGIPFAIWPEE